MSSIDTDFAEAIVHVLRAKERANVMARSERDRKLIELAKKVLIRVKQELAK